MSFRHRFLPVLRKTILICDVRKLINYKADEQSASEMGLPPPKNKKNEFYFMKIEI